jgi:hypothetical protein
MVLFHRLLLVQATHYMAWLHRLPWPNPLPLPRRLLPASRPGPTELRVPLSSPAVPALQVVPRSTGGHLTSTHPVAITPVDNAHAMRTKGNSGFRQPVDHLELQASVLTTVPKSVRTSLLDANWRLAIQAEYDALMANNTCTLVPQLAGVNIVPKSVRTSLLDANWRSAIQAEYDALMANNTCTLVPQLAGVNIVTGKWVYRHMFLADGSLDHYRARWVLHGLIQWPGIDFYETFIPVFKPATIRVVLTPAFSKDWPIHQLDVKNAFLHGTLTKTVYCVQPYGFVDPSSLNHV